MSKQKFEVVDIDGKNVGFVVIEIAAPRFEHTAPAPLPQSGPVYDAMLFAVVLGGFTATPWLFGAPGWVAAGTGVTITAALAGIKAWRSGSGADPGQNGNGAGEELTIKLETWSEDNREVLLDQVEDKSIGLDDWRKLAGAIVDDQANFSRPALAKYISQTTYHKVKTEFVRLNFAHRQGNAYMLSLRGTSFLRKINGLAQQ